MKKSCPRVRFVRQDHEGHVAITAFVGQRQVGIITLRNKISIGAIKVERDLQRCGLGTRLYEKAAKIACEEANAPLRSDIERTLASQRFWEKQVRKGRASCVESEFRPHSPDDMDAVVGRGGCYFYKLTCPAPRSLAGRRKRR